MKLRRAANSIWCDCSSSMGRTFRLKGMMEKHLEMWLSSKNKPKYRGFRKKGAKQYGVTTDWKSANRHTRSRYSQRHGLLQRCSRSQEPTFIRSD
jgi:hypothetical protein